MRQNPNQVVFTNKARCRDCYRCVRVCPVKAIRMSGGQAFVVEQRCISCGTCVRECPQQAKSYKNDLDKAQNIVETNLMVAASIAPSFAAIFEPWARKRLASALRELGFEYVGETATGAYHIAQETCRAVGDDPESAHIATACPAVVSYIEHYRPQAAKMLVGVVSPMIAHAKMIKHKLGHRSKVIFIGPCVAKKAEAARPEYQEIVDCVLTFRELFEWFERKGIALSACEESDFDDKPAGQARLFPLEGGQLRTSCMSTDMLDKEIMSVSGFEEVENAIQTAMEPGQHLFIEPLFCSQGCINGPAMGKEQNTYKARKEIIGYTDDARSENREICGVDLSTAFEVTPVDVGSEISEEQIRMELEKTGKARPEDQLNCGACGYHSCRHKAIAVIQGLAEEQMCIPYMRRLAEQRSDKIIETSPNGIVILDKNLTIILMNPAFKHFFLCTDALYGKKISYLMDQEPFEKVVMGESQLLEQTCRHDKYNLVCHQIMYVLPEEQQVVGIFVNVTNSLANQEKLDQLRSQTITQARELLENQLNMAQKIAQFLGESTAKGEKLVSNLMQFASDESKKTQDKKVSKPWDIYMSK